MNTVTTVDGDSVDLICHQQYGQTAGITEQVFEANPGLAELGPILDAGVVIQLPEAPAPSEQPTINLWD